MSRSRIDPLTGTWTEAISAVSKRPAEDVTSFLERHGLRPQALIPRPVDITIRSMRFSGIKALPGGPEDFDFTWGELGPGLWLIGSDGNSRGKTSLLGVMRWLLRGSPPSQIPPGVLKWIHRASMEFDVGGVLHRVSFDLRGGFAAELAELRDGGPAAPLLSASSAAEFEHGMSDFMMSRLGLEPIVGMRDGETVVQHRWSALFSAFHIGTDYTALLGDTVHDALVNRMLNMFCGFRHAPAVARIQNVVAGFGAEREREDQAARAVTEHARGKLERLRAELAALPAPAPGTPSSAELLSEVRSTSDNLAAAYTRVADLHRLRAEAQEATASARAEMNADRSALLDFKEARAAERVFRRLTPTCCPRCDQTFAEERKERETSARACMVCGGDAPTEDSADVEGALAALEETRRRRCGAWRWSSPESSPSWTHGQPPSVLPGNGWERGGRSSFAGEIWSGGLRTSLSTLRARAPKAPSSTSGGDCWGPTSPIGWYSAGGLAVWKPSSSPQSRRASSATSSARPSSRTGWRRLPPPTGSGARRRRACCAPSAREAHRRENGWGRRPAKPERRPRTGQHPRPSERLSASPAAGGVARERRRPARNLAAGGRDSGTLRHRSPSHEGVPQARNGACSYGYPVGPPELS